MKKTTVNDAYSLKTPEDSIKLYSHWAETYDQDFAEALEYQTPLLVSELFIKCYKNGNTPILDVGAGTGLVGEHLNKSNNFELIGLDISPEMLTKAFSKGCYSSILEADLSKTLPLEDNSIGGIISAGTFTHGHVGPESFDELLRVTKPNGLFVVTIHSKLFINAGFEKKLQKLSPNISNPEISEVQIYGSNNDKDLGDDTVILTMFRKI